MASTSSRPQATAVSTDDRYDSLRLATCPMCHTTATVSQRALEAGGGWRCVRCGQHWDAARLAAVAAYAAWTVEHDRVSKRDTEVSQEAALVCRWPTARPDGKP